MSSKKCDPNVNGLVKAINSYPGIQTLMSCGGHKKPRIMSSQVPENEFYVEFGFITLYPTREAWQSLNEIARSIDEGALYEWAGCCNTGVKIELVNDKRHIVSFRLYGRGVDPNVIVSKMEQNKGKFPIENQELNIPIDKMTFPKITMKELKHILEE